MCPLNALLLIVCILGVPALIKLHFSIYSSQGGDVSDVYVASSSERILDAAFFCAAIGLIALVVGADKGRGLNAHALATSPAWLILGLVLFTALIIGLAVIKMSQTRAQIRTWFRRRGWEVIQFRWCIFDNPWMRDSSGIFSGRSESQSCYKVVVRDREGKTQIAYLLWGSYFGFSFITGRIPIQLIWNKVHALESRLEDLSKQDPLTAKGRIARFSRSSW